MTEQRPSFRFGRDQWIVLASLFLLAALAWAYLIWLGHRMGSMTPSPQPGSMAGMPGMDEMSMAGMAPAKAAPEPLVLTFLMWLVMMLGMMLPSAAPMLLISGSVDRGRPGLAPAVGSAVFLLGYLVVWAAFSLLAAALQGVLSRANLIDHGLTLADRRIAGAALVVAGLYELSPLKRRCLDLCRSPFAFVASHWRPGTLGRLRMGLEHGAYCLGCCWALMLLLFVGGVMNLLWVAALGVLVLAQKLLPGGQLTARVTSAVLILAGVVLIGLGFRG